MQRTLARPISLSGIGVHKGEPARLRILPGPCDSGLRFLRTDIRDRDNLIEARYDAVIDAALCTRIGNRDRVSVATVEHLVAALAGCGVDNALIEIDGPEAPIMDGSAAPFVQAILAAGMVEQSEPLRAIRILRRVCVEEDGKRALLEPADAFEVAFEIDFPDRAIGRQFRKQRMTGPVFAADYAVCRTFGRFEDVEKLRALGFARGGSLANAVVVHGDRVLNPDGLRHPDEFVRHKMLDAVGDLALAGAPIIGRYVGARAGHDMTNRLLRALFDAPDAWRFEILDDRAAAAPDVWAVPEAALDRPRVAAVS